MRIRAFSIEIDPLSMEQAVETVQGWLKEQGEACRYVVTPNVDHIVKLQSSVEFREAYREASLVLTDGKPVFLALRLLEKKVPETVPGSDLVPRLFDAAVAAGRSLRVFWLGAAPGVAERAAANAHSRWPHVQTAGWYSPPFGFERSAAENSKILDLVNRSGADLLVIGLGAPKQELWIRKYRSRLGVGVALCVGATIDFLAGEKKRAPVWMRKICLEWLHRMLSDPKRLVKRYLNDGLVFPKVVVREWKAGKKGPP